MAFTLKDFIGHFYAKDTAWKDSDKQLNYVVAKNGFFEYRKTPLGSSLVKIKEIPTVEEIEEGVSLDIPKIPFQLFNYMTAWHRAVYKKDKAESTIMVFYNENDGFKLFVPQQTNSGTNSKYKRDDDPEYVEMCKDNTLVMVAHSHPWAGSSSPGPSGTDDKDEKESILYMIMNNVEGVPNVYVSTCPGGTRIRLNFFDVFENPMISGDIPKEVASLFNKHVPEKEILNKFSNPESCTIPQEWMNKHTTERYSYTKTAQSGLSTSSYRDANQISMIDDFEDYEYYRSDYYGKAPKVTTFKAKVEEAEEEILPDSVDILDQMLDLDDMNIAMVLEGLIMEGKGTLIKACLNEIEAYGY